MTASLTIGTALTEGRRTLESAGVETSALDARLLLEAALDIDTARIVAAPERGLSRRQQQRYLAFLERRQNREPVSQIVGRRGFWKDEFLVTADTLTPRPESETLIEMAAEHFRTRAPSRVLDLGTGTGCLLISALREFPNAIGIGIDASETACRVAVRNAERLGLGDRVEIIRADWVKPVAGTFDLVLCNPPYIALAEGADLAPEVVEFEPRSALFGGADGLDAYRQLAPQIPQILAPYGVLILEIGQSQSPPVRQILVESGLYVTKAANDLAGIERCLLATVAHT